METSPLNLMVIHPRFPHIVEKVFAFFDKSTLKICRKVAKPWQNYIDNRNLLWNMIVEEQGPNKAFQTASKNGNSKVVEVLIQNSKKFNLDLNSNVAAAFQMTCKNGHSKMVIQKWSFKNG